eukprot:61334-Rhodomonas_salina.1
MELYRAHATRDFAVAPRVRVPVVSVRTETLQQYVVPAQRSYAPTNHVTSEAGRTAEAGTRG